MVGAGEGEWMATDRLHFCIFQTVFCPCVKTSLPSKEFIGQFVPPVGSLCVNQTQFHMEGSYIQSRLETERQENSEIA